MNWKFWKRPTDLELMEKALLNLHLDTLSVNGWEISKITRQAFEAGLCHHNRKFHRLSSEERGYVGNQEMEDVREKAMQYAIGLRVCEKKIQDIKFAIKKAELKCEKLNLENGRLATMVGVIRNDVSITRSA